MTDPKLPYLPPPRKLREALGKRVREADVLRRLLRIAESAYDRERRIDAPAPPVTKGGAE